MKSLVVGRWSFVRGRWSFVRGRWSSVSGQWPLVSGQWSLVSGRWSWVGRRSSAGDEERPVSRSRGFTLVELLVVISLISILAAMGLVQYRNSVLRTQEAVLKTDLFRIRDAIDQYYADKGKYPASLEALVSDGYLRKVPEDPITKSSDTWQTEPAEPDPNNPSAEPGIYNVKSGAQGASLDGTNYSDF